MKIIELRVELDDKKINFVTGLELINLAENLKNYIYDLQDSAIKDVTYEIKEVSENEN